MKSISNRTKICVNNKIVVCRENMVLMANRVSFLTAYKQISFGAKECTAKAENRVEGAVVIIAR